MTDMEKREIAQLRGMGMGYGKISHQLDIPLSTVKSYCLRNNVVSGARKSVCMACGRPLDRGMPGRERSSALMDVASSGGAITRI